MIFKGKSIIRLNKTKAKSKDSRNWVFNTKFFQKNAFFIIEKSIQIYNEKEFTNGMSRTNAEFYNTKIKGKTRETLHLVKSSDQLANQIKKINIQEFKEVENQLIDLKFNMINVRILIR